jgi:ATP-binding cassette subfamily F protein 3
VKEIEQLERKLAAWNEEKQALDAQLADPALYAPDADRAGIDDLHRRLAGLTADIAAAEERWLLAQEELEALPAP